MKKNAIILAFTCLMLGVSAFKVISAEESSQVAETKSVAWYVANLKEAREKNKECFDNPEIKASEGCENALHALQISFKGGN